MAKKKTEIEVVHTENQYEAMFLLPAAAATEVDKSIKTVQGIIERHGGKMLVIKKWDERKLTYEIKKQKRGLFVIAYFTALGNAIAGIERDVNLSEEIIRVLVTDAAHLNNDEMAAVEPQPIQPREERSWDRPPMGEDGGGFRPRPRFERNDAPAGAGRD